MKNIFLSFIVFICVCVNAQEKTLAEKANDKIKELNDLIAEAEKQNIDVFKEKTTIATAKMFLKFADWDAANITTNTTLFKNVPLYRDNATVEAKNLARFERNEVNEILDTAIKNLNVVLKGGAVRQKSVLIDWGAVEIQNDHVSYNGVPVFLTDFLLKPKRRELNTYFGDQDAFSTTTSYLSATDGLVKQSVIDVLDRKTKSDLGVITFNHSQIDDWMLEKYGNEFLLNKNSFTVYDIDHPAARKIEKNILSEIVPYTAGHKISELGYILDNFPNFSSYTTQGVMASGTNTVTKFTKQKFKFWLEKKYTSIANLNKKWKTTYVDFDAVNSEIPLDIKTQGSPIWYDWSLFNMYRVTDWYTYLKYRVQKDDPEAKVHVKLNTDLWTSNDRSHGVDFEAITKLSGLLGNSTGAKHIEALAKKDSWRIKYDFDWRELCMGYDFMKSISPNKLLFNSQSHFISSLNSQDLYLDPNYARAVFWLSHMYGESINNIWYWPRRHDGSLRIDMSSKLYAGSINQQARVTNEVAMTMIDLNANAETILEIQRQRKPVRIFYSKTSAIQKKNHMDQVFELYESLNFNGVPLGFVTEDILKSQEPNWDIVLVKNTEYVTENEFEALQSYLNNGGTIIVDSQSLQKNAYGQSLNKKLTASNGKIINVESLSEFATEGYTILKEKGSYPEIEVKEINGTGANGCVWRVVKNKEGKEVLSIINLGKTEAKLTITRKGVRNIICRDIITGTSKSAIPVLAPLDVYFVEIEKL